MNQKLPVPKRKKKMVNLGIGSCRLGQCEDMYLGTYLTFCKDTEVQRYTGTCTEHVYICEDRYLYVVPTYVPRYFLG